MAVSEMIRNIKAFIVSRRAWEPGAGGLGFKAQESRMGVWQGACVRSPIADSCAIRATPPGTDVLL